MSLLPQFAWLEALGWTIVNSLWQFGILWMVWLLLQKVWPRASASTRYNLAVSILLLGTSWAFLGFIARCIDLHQQLSDASNSYSTVGFGGLDQIRQLPGILFPYLSIAYLTWLAYKITQLFIQFKSLKTLGSSGLHRVPAQWRVFLETMSAQMNLGRKVQIWLSDKIDSPQIMGSLKPIILLPAAAICQLSADQLEAIIIHELAHIKRNDYIWNWVVAIIETIFFFNVFVKLFVSTIREEREHACDDWVLQFPFQPAKYAEALLSLEQQRSEKDMKLILAARGNSRKLLLTRVRRMLNIPHTQQQHRPSSRMLAYLCMGIFLTWLIPTNRVTREIVADFVQPVSRLENKLFKGLNLEAIQLDAALTSFQEPLQLEALQSEEHAQVGNKSINSITDKQLYGTDNQEIYSDQYIAQEEPIENTWSVTNGLEEPSVAVFRAAAAIEKEQKAFTFEKGVAGTLPEEASTIYMHPYVPRKSFESTPLQVDTTPALRARINAEKKAQEAAIQTQVALEKLNWTSLKQQLNQLASQTGSKKELQELLEKELAKLNWKDVQQQASIYIKQLNSKQLELEFIKQRELQESTLEKLEELQSLNQELQVAEKAIQQAIQEKEKDLRIKQEQLRKKHKIVHI